MKPNITTMCSDIGTTSRVCAMYSFTGILFTVSAASYHCVIGGMKRLSRLNWAILMAVDMLCDSNCWYCNCWYPSSEIDVMMLQGGTRTNVRVVAWYAIGGGQDGCDVGALRSNNLQQFLSSRNQRMIIPQELSMLIRSNVNIFVESFCSWSLIFFSILRHCELSLI